MWQADKSLALIVPRAGYFRGNLQYNPAPRICRRYFLQLRDGGNE